MLFSDEPSLQPPEIFYDLCMSVLPLEFLMRPHEFTILSVSSAFILGLAACLFGFSFPSTVLNFNELLYYFFDPVFCLFSSSLPLPSLLLSRFVPPFLLYIFLMEVFVTLNFPP